MFSGDGGNHLTVNQDELLQRHPSAIGGKTGFTNAARKTFISTATRGGHQLMITMMHGVFKYGRLTYLGGIRPATCWIGISHSTHSSASVHYNCSLRVRIRPHCGQQCQ